MQVKTIMYMGLEDGEEQVRFIYRQFVVYLRGSRVKIPLECIVTLQNGFSNVTIDLH